MKVVLGEVAGGIIHFAVLFIKAKPKFTWRDTIHWSQVSLT